MNRTRFNTFFLFLTLSILMVSTIGSAAAMDEDIWWHLRAGNLILAQHHVPWTDTFSSHTLGKPWIAYTWLFDIFVARLFDWFGYRAILALTTLVAMAYTVGMAAFLGYLTNLRRGLILAFVAYIALMPLKSPRPWLFTVFFFAVEFSCLWLARERDRPIWLLPIVPLMILWANVHIQFVYGLGLVGLFALDLSLPDSLREKISAEPRPTLPALWLWMLLVACVLATLVNPYGWNLYRVVVEYATQTEPLKYVQEMQAIPFRNAAHWFTLTLIGAAVFVLGSWRRKSVLLILGLVCSSYFGFRSMRDVWFPVTFAVIALAASLRRSPEAVLEPLGPIYAAGTPLATAVVILFLAYSPRFSDAAVNKTLDEGYPVKAANYIESHSLEGPLFNSYNWGGYLIWRLPQMPVSIDGRANLYEDSLTQSVKTVGGHITWSADPDLKRAHTILLDREGALTSILRVDPKYRIVYEDKVSTIFQPAAATASSTAAAP